MQDELSDSLYKRYAVTLACSDCLYASGFRSVSLPYSGFFSPFPHGTGSLSVDQEYLALEDGPPMFRQDYTCPALLEGSSAFYLYGTITHFGATFQTLPVLTDEPLGCSPFARHYLGNLG